MTRKMTSLVVLAALLLSSCHRCRPSDSVSLVVETFLRMLPPSWR